MQELANAVLAAEPAEERLDMAACVDLARRHDQAASRALVDAMYPLVIKIVRAHLPRRTSEEDLAQTIFMKIFANLEQYSGRVPLRNWVSRIAVNTCFNQLQSERIRPELRWADLSEEEARVVETMASSEAEISPAASLASRDLVEKLLERLSPPERLVISLLHLEERSVEEISGLTGWTKATVKIRAFRARIKLRKHLKTLMKEAN
jgi:RNA polymerase sigma-70 factor (ECF subfamily)